MPPEPRGRAARDRGRGSDRVRQVRPRRSRSPRRSAARWSTPTRCSSTAAWTSAPRSSPAPSGAACPHHLLDVWDVTETASVADYQQPRAGGRRRAARRPVVRRCSSAAPASTCARCSTTSSSPAPIPTCARGSRPSSSRVGSGALHARLAALDPEAAAAILPSNGRRVVRALEVVEITGGRFTRDAARGSATSTPRCRSASTCRARCSTRASTLRVERMWAAGLVEEVRRLLDARPARGASRRRARSATPRCSRLLDGELTEAEASRRPSARRAASPDARTPGSAATPASSGSRTTPPPTSRSKPLEPHASPPRPSLIVPQGRSGALQLSLYCASATRDLGDGRDACAEAAAIATTVHRVGSPAWRVRRARSTYHSVPKTWR